MSHAPSTSAKPEARTLKREFTLWSSFAFAFAFISPIVALHGIFGLAYIGAGPSFWWGFFIVFAGQFLVALIFAVLVSRWPLEGSIYQWASRLIGPGYGWFAGWFYIWTLVIAMSTVALGAAGFLAAIFGVADQATTVALIAFGILIFGTGINLVGRIVLKAFMGIAIVATVIGSVGLSIWLLLFHRVQSLSVLLDGGASIGESLQYFAVGGPFLLALAFIGWSFVGFESAAAISEEVAEPRRDVPKAILSSLVLIAIVVMFSALALILTIPDEPEQLAGWGADPVYAVLTAHLGTGISVWIQILFVIGFVASFLALQTSASRLIWAKARDNALPASGVLVKLTKRQHQPIAAVLFTTAVGTLLLLVSSLAENVYAIGVNFTAGGFYLSFLFPVLGFAIVYLRGRWVSGKFSLGSVTGIIAIVATVWAFYNWSISRGPGR
ncbi:APC family permease [Sanguibacter sp. Z1732]|uniref:APC family permease n=1 Tax=Sanguibacter sp. Z1732 TaxID=3435412 RepID=UPI003D9C9DEC